MCTVHRINASRYLSDQPLHHSVVGVEQCLCVHSSWPSKAVIHHPVACEQESVRVRHYCTMIEWQQCGELGRWTTTTASLRHQLASAGKSSPHRNTHCCDKISGPTLSGAAINEKWSSMVSPCFESLHLHQPWLKSQLSQCVLSPLQQLVLCHQSHSARDKTHNRQWTDHDND